VQITSNIFYVLLYRSIGYLLYINKYFPTNGTCERIQKDSNYRRIPVGNGPFISDYHN